MQKKKEEAAPEVTPLERMLQTAGTLRPDGSDKFFGMENVSIIRECLHFDYKKKC